MRRSSAETDSVEADQHFPQRGTSRHIVLRTVQHGLHQLKSIYVDVPAPSWSMVKCPRVPLAPNILPHIGIDDAGGFGTATNGRRVGRTLPFENMLAKFNNGLYQPFAVEHSRKRDQAGFICVVGKLHSKVLGKIAEQNSPARSSAPIQIPNPRQKSAGLFIKPEHGPPHGASSNLIAPMLSTMPSSSLTPE